MFAAQLFAKKIVLVTGGRSGIGLKLRNLSPTEQLYLLLLEKRTN